MKKNSVVGRSDCAPIGLERTATAMQKVVFALEGREDIPERLLQPADVAAVVITCLSLPRSAEAAEIDVRPIMKSQEGKKPIGVGIAADHIL